MELESRTIKGLKNCSGDKKIVCLKIHKLLNLFHKTYSTTWLNGSVYLVEIVIPCLEFKTDHF